MSDPQYDLYIYILSYNRPYNQPATQMGYTENLLYMMDKLSEAKYTPNPKLARALDVLFILHADHEVYTAILSLLLPSIFSSIYIDIH